MSVAFAIVSCSGAYWLVNKRAQDLVEKSEYQRLGKRPHDLLDRDQARLIMEGNEKVRSTRQAVPLESRVETTSGPLLSESTKTPLRDANGELRKTT